MRLRLGNMRKAFVLPMSLVATFIALIIVGASARYCTTTMMTTREYANRSRCRMVGQSAMELVKASLKKHQFSIADVTSTSFGGMDLKANLSALEDNVRGDEDLREQLRWLTGDDPNMKVYFDIKDQDNVSSLFVTAECTVAGRTTSITLREDVKMQLGKTTSVFDYAYFANNDGHLLSRRLTVNGDVHCNGDFHIIGGVINGFINAVKKIYMRESTIFNSLDLAGLETHIVGRRTYNESPTYRNNTYAKMRPTDPLKKNGTDWPGGYDPIVAKKGILFNLIQWEEDDVPIYPHDGSTYKSRMYEKFTESGDYIPHEGVSFIGMPKIVPDSEPENAERGEYHLQFYKDRAANALTPLGRTGGSLICSNCFYNAVTKSNEQFSAKLRLSWQNGEFSQWGTATPPENEAAGVDTSKLPEGVDPSKKMPDYEESIRQRSDMVIPSTAIPVYNCIRADQYRALSDPDKTANWRQLKPGTGDARHDDGPVGHIVSGNANFDAKSLEGLYAKDGDLFENGSGVFYSVDEFSNAIAAQVKDPNLGKSIADQAQTKFSAPGWDSYVADFNSTTVHRGEREVDLRSVRGSAWKKDKPGINLHMDKIPGPGYFTTTKPGSTTISLVNIDGAFFQQSDLNAVASAFSANPGVSASDNVFSKWDDAGWSLKPSADGTYYSTETGFTRGYWVFELIEKYEDGKPSTYRVIRNWQEGKGMSQSAVKRTFADTNSDYLVFDYNSLYYSTLPAGYIEVRAETNLVDQVVSAKFTYTSLHLKEPPAAEVAETLVGTVFIEARGWVENDTTTNPNRNLYTRVSSSSSIRKGYMCRVSSSGLANMLVDMDLLAEDETLKKSAKARFGISGAEIDAVFAQDGWYSFNNPSSPYLFYTDDPSGFVAIEVYEQSLNGVSIGRRLKSLFMTKAQKADREKADRTRDKDFSYDPNGKNNLMVYYLPLHRYKASLATGDVPSKWTQLSSSGSGSTAKWGYQDVTDTSVYKGYLACWPDIMSIYEDSNDVTEWLRYDIDDYFSSSSRQSTNWKWSKQTSGYYSNEVVGYVVVRIVYGSSRDDFAFSFKPTIGPENASFDPDESINSVPAGCIPVYLREQDVDNAQKHEKYWQPIASTPGFYLNAVAGAGADEMSNQFIKKADLTSAAQRYAEGEVGSHVGVTVAEITDMIMGLFKSGGDLYKRGWREGSPTDYYRVNPAGYIEISATYSKGTRPVLTAKYRIKTVSAGEVTVTREGEIDPEYYLNHPDEYYRDHPEVVPPAPSWPDQLFTAPEYREETAGERKGMNHGARADDARRKEPLTRELRGVFVRNGYKMITDDMFVVPSTGDRLIVSDKDMILTGDADVSKKNGYVRNRADITTADLRPFREDPLCQCNRRCDLAGSGSAADKGAVILIGTWDNPIIIDGPVIFESDVLIRGFVSGRGSICSGRNIHVIGDINYKNPPFWPENAGGYPDTKGKDMLMLIARGSIVIGNYAKKYENASDYVDPAWGKLLSNHYIDAQPNTSDRLSRYGTGSTYVPYVAKNYKNNDTVGGTRYKIVFRDEQLAQTPAKFYESVVGDWVFQSLNDTNGYNPDEAGALGLQLPKAGGQSPNCSCRFAQSWDLNFADPMLTAACDPKFVACQSHVIEDFINAQNNWTESMRTGKTLGYDFSRFGLQGGPLYLTFREYCRNNYFGSSKSNKPHMNNISEINAVLYASEGIYGVVGGKNANCVINGGLYAQDEALLPFARDHRGLLFGGVVGNDDIAITLNWDIRLNLKSAEAIYNNEAGEAYSSPLVGGEAKKKAELISLSWQEVPSTFNEQYGK